MNHPTEESKSISLISQHSEITGRKICPTHFLPSNAKLARYASIVPTHVHSIATNVNHGTPPKLTCVLACGFLCALLIPSPTMIMSRRKHTVVRMAEVMIIPRGEERGEESEEFFFGGGDAGAEAVE